jgi:hypothetical protein
VIVRNGAGVALDLTDNDARKIAVLTGERDNQSSKLSPQSAQVYTLHRGRSRRPLVRIIPCRSLYRVEWPDGSLSDLANLTRCRQAAREWAEEKVISHSRKLPVARRLKSLDNFSWSSSPVAQNFEDAP